MDPPPYTLTNESSTRPTQRIKFVDGKQVLFQSVNNDIIDSYSTYSEQDEPQLQYTSESQTFFFYGHSSVDDGLGGELRIQSFPFSTSNNKNEQQQQRSTPRSLLPSSNINTTSASVMSTRRSSTVSTITNNTTNSTPASITSTDSNTTPYKYPANYLCFKCRNTGITGSDHNRKPCSRCFRNFSTQKVRYKNPLVNVLNAVTRRQSQWVDRGDGTCARCLGSGKRRMGECNVCEGRGVWP